MNAQSTPGHGNDVHTHDGRNVFVIQPSLPRRT